MPLPRPGRRRLALPAIAAACAAALAAAPPAAAATKVVYAGPPEPPAGAPASLELDAFFRRHLTIRAGGRVRWEMRGFHTVTFIPKEAAAPKFVDIDLTRRMTGYRDATGAPYWFSDTGLPTLFLGNVTLGGWRARSALTSIRRSRPPPWRC